MVNLEQAKLHPEEVFKNPIDVVNCDELTRTEKIEILWQWAYDERELMVAEGENMQAHNQSERAHLEKVLKALLKLGASHDPYPSPTSHGG